MKIAILGLTITSSWGNGHATTYRALVKALHQSGHSVTFYEQDVDYYACTRDLPEMPYGEIILYDNYYQLADFKTAISEADVVVIGSFVPDGVAVIEWVMRHASGLKVFYDMDTPVTLANLERASCTYLLADQVEGFDIYLSVSGGPTLDVLRDQYGSRCPVLFPCCVDPELYRPNHVSQVKWDLGYMGTYTAYRQQNLDHLLVKAAEHCHSERFVVAGSLYPSQVMWPENVERIDHLSPYQHCDFYNSQRFTLNLTREEMMQTGYSASVRLFEAAACGVPIISDRWSGIETFLIPDEEILLADSYKDVVKYLRNLPEEERQRVAANGRKKVLAQYTSAHRAEQLIQYVKEYAYLMNS